MVWVRKRVIEPCAPSLSITGPTTSSVFKRSRGDIRRHALKITHPATMTPTRTLCSNDSISSGSQGDRDPVGNEGASVR